MAPRRERRFFGRLLLAQVLAVAGPASAVAAPPPNPWWEAYYEHSERVTLPEGRHMRLYCEGAGSPPVVLESGLGSDAEDWRFVQDSIAHTTRVCSYDRAGLGGSDPGPIPRDAAAMASDLEHMLAAAKISGPYVLVGHSLGSYDLQLFADVYRRKVAGMVLVDPATAPEGLKVAPPASRPNTGVHEAGRQRPVAARYACVRFLRGRRATRYAGRPGPTLP